MYGAGKHPKIRHKFFSDGHHRCVKKMLGPFHLGHELCQDGLLI